MLTQFPDLYLKHAGQLYLEQHVVEIPLSQGPALRKQQAQCAPRRECAKRKKNEQSRAKGYQPLDQELYFRAQNGVFVPGTAELMRPLIVQTVQTTQIVQTELAPESSRSVQLQLRLFFDLVGVHPPRGTVSLQQYEPDEWSVGGASSVAGGSQYRWARLLLQCPDESNAVGEACRAHDPRRGSYTLRVNRSFISLLDR